MGGDYFGCVVVSVAKFRGPIRKKVDGHPSTRGCSAMLDPFFDFLFFCSGWANIMSRWWFQIFFIFTPNLEEMIQFDDHMFQMGWFKHQRDHLCTEPGNCTKHDGCFVRFFPFPRTILGVHHFQTESYMVFNRAPKDDDR